MARIKKPINKEEPKPERKYGIKDHYLSFQSDFMLRK